MSQQPYIDGFEFAASGGARAGRWPLRDLPRLRSSLAALDGELEYALRGTHDPMGRRALQLKLRGVLKLSCQRCLETMDFPLDVDAMLVLATSEAEIDADADDPAAPDRVLASREMPIRELIEDEVLLSLPFAPRHERCGTHHDSLGEQRRSPFAALSAMLDAPRGDGHDRRR
ncbi:MAG: hypothetical protein AMJ64_07735 [Betaproteobacteria bacterium SG8_39]|nr:MAG: hypothetical protein AMJ64_07735 [Betaproteobacteria bacterium SG8_39]